jgi:predicted PurR-regulated permease PerM
VARLISFIVLAAIIVLFAFLFFQVMAQFLLPMFLAVILVVMFRPVHHWFIVKCGGRIRTAAGLTTLAILLIVLAPMISILILATNDAIEVLQQGFNPEILVSKLEKLRHNLGLDFGLDINEIRKLPEVEGHIDQLVAAAYTSQTLAEQREQVARIVPLLEAEINNIDSSLDPQRFNHSGAQPDAQAQEQFTAAKAKVGDMRTLLARIRQEAERPDVPPSDEPQRAAAEPLDALKEPVDALKSTYYEFKDQVVGGPMLENLRIWANPTPDDIARARSSFVDWLQSYALQTGTFLGGFLANFVIGLAVLVISLYYFLADGPAMIATIMRLLPLDDRYERQLVDEFDRISRAVVLATLLSALVQGLLAGLGFFIFGPGAVFLLTVVTMLMALVPFVGAAAVWGTCSVWLLLYEEKIGAAIGLAIYGICIISMADNVIKPIVLHGQSKLHPLLALLSVLGGVRALGPIGIFVGPMAVAFLQALLNILNTELTALSQRTPTLHAPD